MKYYLIAGERSGDLHGAALVRSIKAHDPQAQIRCVGGEQLREAGAEIAIDYSQLSYMGFLEVFLNLRKIMGYMRQVKQDIAGFGPDALILIDYPGFNLRMAKFGHQQGLKVFYYISPKIWAWNQSRAFKIKKWVDRMFVILPFEVDFYQKFDYNVSYVGNPLVQELESFQPDPDFSSSFTTDQKPWIAILPGSRAQEVMMNLPVLLEMVKRFPDYQFVIAGVSNLRPILYQQARDMGVPVIVDRTYDVLHNSQVALVVSGTATLETAILGVPQVVCYRTSWITYWIARMLIKIDFISLVNLIAGKELVPELIQADLNPDHLERRLSVLLEGPERDQQTQGFAEIRNVLGKGNSADLTALSIVSSLAG